MGRTGGAFAVLRNLGRQRAGPTRQQQAAGTDRNHQQAAEAAANAAAGVPADVLTGHFLQPRVQVVAVRMNLGEVVVTDQARALPGRVPGRARRKFAFLDQNRIGATFLCEVVQQPDAHNAAADNNDLCM